MHLGIDPQGGISKQCEEVFFYIQFEHALHLAPLHFPQPSFQPTPFPTQCWDPFLLMGLDRMGDGEASRENKAEYSIKAKGRCFSLLYTVYSMFLRPPSVFESSNRTMPSVPLSMRILRISSRQHPQRVGRQAAYVSSDFHVIIDSFLYTTFGFRPRSVTRRPPNFS